MLTFENFSSLYHKVRYMSISRIEIPYNFFMKYAERIKELRLEAGETQTELAAFLNIRQNTYSQYETGQRQISLDTLVALARHFEVSTDYILGLTDLDTPYPHR